MATTGILPQAAPALPCASRLLSCPRIKHGAGFEDKQNPVQAGIFFSDTHLKSACKTSIPTLLGGEMYSRRALKAR
jgi:hypothetical protein